MDRAVALAPGSAEAERGDVGDQRPRGGEAPFLAAIVAEAYFRPALRLEAGGAGGDVDGAGRGVLAIQRALRPAQHFHLLQIDQIELRLADAAVIDAVDEDADALLEAVARQCHVGAKAANVDVGVARVEREELQRGDQLRNLLQVDRAGLRQRVGRDDAEGNRHILRALFAATGSDKDVERAVGELTGICGRVGGRKLDGFGLLGARSIGGRQQRCRKGKRKRSRRCHAGKTFQEAGHGSAVARKARGQAGRPELWRERRPGGRQVLACIIMSILHLGWNTRPDVVAWDCVRFSRWCRGAICFQSPRSLMRGRLVPVSQLYW
nr:hypothetical protein [Sandaracinobacteroides hominis]